MAGIVAKSHSQMVQSATLTSNLPRIGSRRWVFAGLVVILTSIFLVSLALGSVNIPLREVLAVLTGGETGKATWNTIILSVRLPKALTAMLAGSALGISGLLMQTLFRNPLADPFILGISSGASLGVALVVLSVGAVGTSLLAGIGVLGDLGLAVAASLGAAGVLLIVLWMARRVPNNMTLLIVGLLFGYLTSALVSLLLYFGIPERIQAYITWTFGSFGGVTWSQMQILAPVVLVGLGISFLLSKALNALLLGEAYAESMGLNIRQSRLAIIVTTALLAGTVTAFCGPVGFIGIAIPHLCRGFFGTSDHRTLIPATIVTGAIIALVAAFVAEVPGSNIILPLNAVTSLIGAPAVIWVVLRRQNMRRTFAS